MELIRSHLDLPPKAYSTDLRLQEINLGAWDGLTHKQARALDPVEFNKREADKWNVRLPGGESYADVAKRAERWLASMKRDTFAVTHGGFTRILRGLFDGIDAQEISDLDEPQGVVFRVRGSKIKLFDKHAVTDDPCRLPLLLYVIRHGECEHNAAGWVAGHDDSPLTTQGREQARANGRLLREIARAISDAPRLLRQLPAPRLQHDGIAARRDRTAADRLSRRRTVDGRQSRRSRALSTEAFLSHGRITSPTRGTMCARTARARPWFTRASAASSRR